ncbi:MAG: lycopene cyclase domain-containing protein [Ignavibacteria bacterium]|nr:lycopene cyclase domain-containing protein [Ignavibacteria bacterium]MCC7158009.1 lycopene cyclase domain-containing protein [Ignavibacteria bacterium]
MKEYTILAVFAVFLAILTDFLLRTKLLKNIKFWIFWGVMFVLIFMVNGYLTYRPIVLYGKSFHLGIRLFTIPIEDFLYGFALLTMNISIWEYFTRRFKNKFPS